MMLIFKEAFLIFMIAATAMAQAPGVASSSTQPGSNVDTYSPITSKERLEWILKSTLGPKNLAAGLVVSGWGTWHNNPSEYGPGWQGYGERYGLRLTVGGTSNAMEAGLGSIWGEDPRYFPATGQPLAKRLGHVVGGAFITRDRSGNPMPAYARYIAVPGTAYLSNTWRPDSEAKLGDATLRIGLGFVSRIVGNAFSEFVPDLRRRGTKRAPPAQSGDAQP